MRFKHSFAYAAVSLMALTTPAFAQDVPEDGAAEDAENSKEIVVTGTLIRGAPPVGSQQITLGEERIQEVGAISSNELLASIPQVTNFFNRVPLADLGIQVTQIQVSRPNIRNLNSPNSASSATLILVDGHRLAGLGTTQSSVDPDLIPTGAIERVDVLTEGGSATYGADAVAGVINFVTRRRFDGVKVDGSFGFADDYKQYAANLTVGKTWENSSVYLAYSFTKNDGLFGRDRGFIRNLDYSALPYRGFDRECASPNLSINTVFTPANFTISSVNYAAPAFVANTSNRCDNNENRTQIPSAERHGALIGFSQDFGDRTTLDARAYFGQRKTSGSRELSSTVTVAGNNPFVGPSLPPGVFIGTVNPVIANRASVSFSFAPAVGIDAGYSRTRLREWGGRVELKHEFSDAFEVRALANFSKSDSSFAQNEANVGRLNAAGSGTTAATAINPFNVAQTSPALLADILDNELAARARDQLTQLRLIGQARLFTLPGGEVRLAVGTEYLDTRLSKRTGNSIRIGTLGNLPAAVYKRDVKSVFSELQVPLFGDDNARKGMHSLVLSGAVRYDKYSDFGSTTNPKFGLTYEVIEGFRFRGNWGTSFTAPNALDQLGSLNNVISSFPFVPFPRPGDVVPGGSFAVAIQGSQPNLQPQEADTWSVGVDIEPTKGLKFSASYYDVKFTNILGTPTPSSLIFANFPNNVQASVSGLTPAQLRAFGALAPGGSAVVEPLIAAGTLVYETIDFRVGNFGILKLKGMDFNANFRQDTDFGGFDLGLSGNLQLDRKRQASPTAGITDDLLFEASVLQLQANAGLDIGGFRGQVTFNHSDGYNIPRTTSVPAQTHVKAFNTFDLFFKYDFPESGITRDLSLTLNVRNVGDTDPPVLLRNNPNENGFANGFTYGRTFILGLSKKF